MVGKEFEKLYLKNELLLKESKSIIVFLEKNNIETLYQLFSTNIDDLVQSVRVQKSQLLIRGLYNLLEHKYLGKSLDIDVILDSRVKIVKQSGNVDSLAWPKHSLARLGFTPEERKLITSITRTIINQEMSIIDALRYVFNVLKDCENQALKEKIILYLNAYEKNRKLSEQNIYQTHYEDLKLIFEEEKKLLLELQVLTTRYGEITERLSEIQQIRTKRFLSK